MADDVLEAYRRGLDVRDYRRMLELGTLPVDERAEQREAYRRQIPVDQLRRERAARVGAARAAQSATPSGALGSPESTEEATTAAAIQQYRGRPMPGVGEGGTLQPGSGMAAPEPPDEVQQALSRARGDLRRQRNRPTTRMTPAVSEADALNQRELDRIAAARGVLSGGDIQPRELNLDERIGASMDRTLGRIGLRRTNETGEGAPSTGSFREDLRGLGRALGLKKGGKVKKMAKGGVVKAPSASRRGDGIAARGKTKGRMV